MKAIITFFDIPLKVCLLFSLILFTYYFRLYYNIQFSISLIESSIKYSKWTNTPTFPLKQSLFKESNFKYILKWTKGPYPLPFDDMGKGRYIFLKYKCPVNNCYVTSNKTLLSSLTKYHVILFHGPDLNTNTTLPHIRSIDQYYVFMSIESSHNYPINDTKYDFYFNFTWTYKLSSDLYCEYIIIKNKDGVVIGPKEVMHWIKFEDMSSINTTLQKALRQKKSLAAWFVTNCETRGKRENYVNEMQIELAKYNDNNLSIDIFGECSKNKLKCSEKYIERCMSLIKRNYYFYLSFENSFAEDYVTEKLLTALRNDAVPVVFGGANYTRFMPHGAYLNARDFTAKALVQRMINITKNITNYYDFFRWKNYYSYHDILSESPECSHLCTFCAKMNEIRHHKLSYNQTSFTEWWNS